MVSLNRLEHFLLSMQVDDIEPLFILYADTKRRFGKSGLDEVLQSIMNLVNKGYSKCFTTSGSCLQECTDFTILELRERFDGQTESEKLEYPTHVDEYYFAITNSGREEESKKQYDQYYAKEEI